VGQRREPFIVFALPYEPTLSVRGEQALPGTGLLHFTFDRCRPTSRHRGSYYERAGSDRLHVHYSRVSGRDQPRECECQRVDGRCQLNPSVGHQPRLCQAT
jgi:hypothetical protein